MKIIAKLVKSFTQNKDQGNPTAIILNADNLTDEQMQSIAKKLNFSETVFVHNSDKADYKLRFFAPKKEVNLCGHGTIAAFHIISQHANIQSKDLMQETKAGLLPIILHKTGFIQMTQADPIIFDFKIDNKTIAKILNIKESDIIGECKIVSTGTPKLIIPLNSLVTLFKVKPNFEAIVQYGNLSGSCGFYPFTCESLELNSDFHARQFNPASGVNEDPITGVAAGALAVYLNSQNLSSKKNFIIEQGYIMNKAGKIYVDISKIVIVGGYAIQYDEIELSLNTDF